MIAVLDDVFPPMRNEASAFSAEVLDDATDVGDEVRVIVPGFDDGAEFHGPCRWAPRAGDDGPVYPTRGDHALVVFDDDRTPWIVAWSPA